MGKFKDLTGQRFGKLTVIRRGEDYISPKGYHAVNWICMCDCGNVVVVRGCNLKNGKSLSCGCIRIDHPNRTTHGKRNTRIYRIWKSMKNRCYDENSKSYKDYGGRGINVCDEWRNDFQAFYKWSISNGYTDKLSIDRIDNDAGYNPNNCRWTDNETQANNTRHNHYITFHGTTMTISQWSKKTGIKAQKIKDRINKCGWPVEKALSVE